jgi:hypothetical protein
MPGWQPTWADVTFDHAAASAAAESCRAAAQRVDDVLEGLVRSARSARVGWIRLGRDAFDTDVHAAITVLSAMRDDLLALARRIEAARDDAIVEQARRERERERWHRERAEADRRRRAQQARGPRVAV